jgi:hypothetical protein
LNNSRGEKTIDKAAQVKGQQDSGTDHQRIISEVLMVRMIQNVEAVPHMFHASERDGSIMWNYYVKPL